MIKLEQVDSSIRDLINAVILRTVQDAKLERAAISSYSSAYKNKIMAEAVKDIESEDFEYMCECVGKDSSIIRKKLL